MLSPTTLAAAFDRVSEYWSPKVIGQVNDQLLKVAKLKGEFVWHAHEGQDELFYIVKGSLRIEFEDEAVDLEQGDFLTVPSGVRHNPVAREECWVLLIEPAATKHTGEEITSRTRSLAIIQRFQCFSRRTFCRNVRLSADHLPALGLAPEQLSAGRLVLA